MRDACFCEQFTTRGKIRPALSELEGREVSDRLCEFKRGPRQMLGVTFRKIADGEQGARTKNRKKNDGAQREP